MPTEIRVVLPSPGLEEVLSIADDDLTPEETGSRLDDAIKSYDDLTSSKNQVVSHTAELQNRSIASCSASPYIREAFQLSPKGQRVPYSSPSSSPVPSTFDGEEIPLQRKSSSDQSCREKKTSRVSNKHQIPPRKISDSKRIGRMKVKEIPGKNRKTKTATNERELYGRINCATQTDDNTQVEHTSQIETEVQRNSSGNRPNSKKMRPATASARLGEGHNSRSKLRVQESIKLSVTGTYDLDLEHHDIMVKALNSYKQHYKKDSGRIHDKALADDTVLRVDGTLLSPRDRESVAATNESSSTNRSSNPVQVQGTKVGRIYDYDCLVAQLWANNFNVNPYVSHGENNNTGTQTKTVVPSTDGASDDNPVNFKLANCRLIYNDVNTKRQRRPQSAILSRKSSTKSVDSSGGVLVDSIGHVYGKSKPRPLSALPCKFSSFLKTVGAESKEVKDDKRLIDADNHRKSLLKSGKVKIVTIQPPRDDMAQPIITRSVAFNRRNRTTFSWADSPAMSQSLPNASFLHKQYTCSPPRMGTPRSASPTSNSSAGKPSFSQRPSSSYSYDGGFFLGAHSGQSEYFVIHPDWVSEALTIRKLNGNKTDEDKIKNFKRKPPQRRWSDRRCLSAPPPKFRNPITWDSSTAVDIPHV